MFRPCVGLAGVILCDVMVRVRRTVGVGSSFCPMSYEVCALPSVLYSCNHITRTSLGKSGSANNCDKIVVRLD